MQKFLSGLVAGSNDNAIYEKTSNKNDYGISIGENAGTNHINGSRNVAIGHAAASRVNGSDNYAIGEYAGGAVVGNSNLSMMKNAGEYTSGNQNVSIGEYAGWRNQGDSNIAIGNNAGKNVGQSGDFASNNIAIGKGANLFDKSAPLTSDNNIAIGTDAKANPGLNGNAAIALGNKAQALANNAISIGNGNIVRGENSGAIGDPTTITGSGTYSIGNNNGTINVFNAGVFGNDNTLTDNARASRVIGNNNVINGHDAFILGNDSKALANYDIVIGKDAMADSTGNTGDGSAVAIGYLSRAIAQGAIALGSSAYATSNTVSVGYAAGSGSTDSSGVWIGTHAGSTSTGLYNIGIGLGAGSSIGDTNSDSNYNVGLGVYAGNATNGTNNLALGTNAGLIVTGNDNVNLGNAAGTNVNGNNNIAIGRQAGTAVTVNKDINNLEFDFVSRKVNDAISLGNNAQALSDKSIAIGLDTKANNEGDVALGSGSETAEAVSTIEATVNGITYSGFAGIAPKSTVSVGKVGEERTITNVAAGRIKPTSTDAINGSQLYMVASTLTEQLYAQGEGIKNIIGGDTIYDPNTGAFTNNNIGGTGANNINDAIKSVNTAAVQSKTTVTQGDNIVVKESKNADGSTNYKVSTSRNLTVDSITAGDTKVMDAGLSIKDGPSITKAGIDAGDKKVTNVANATISSDSKDAVNGSQLYAQGEGIKNIIGGDTIYDPNTGAFTNNNIGGTGANNINDAIKSVNTAAVQSKTTVTQGDNIVVKESKNADGSTNYKVSTSRNLTVDSITAGDTKVMDAGLSIKDGPSITKAGIDAGDKKVTNVANATISSDSKDAVNGSQLYATNQKVDENTVKINKGLDFTADDNAKHHSQLGDTVAVNGDDNITTSVTNKGVKVALNKDVKVNSVQAGNIHISNNEVTIGNGNNAVSLTENGLNNGGNRITNVANGENDSDAVNMGQLRSVNNTINKRVDDLGERVHKNRKRSDAGIAGVAAMSTIPQVILPGKSGLGIGTASRHGQGAIAIGYSRASDNGKHIIKLSGSYDSQRNNTVAAGYMYQW
ncbi:YadA-like family protein [[Pasteurella] aerogenes]|nr:YadA-like family protein [[Pasteurella] aerogenes]